MAQALFITETTVKAHLRHIYEKLGVRSRTEAAVELSARGRGLGDVGDTFDGRRSQRYPSSGPALPNVKSSREASR